MCEPDAGEWLGFRLGMSKVEALAAGCKAVLAGEIKPNSSQLSVVGGECVVAPRVADLSGKWGLFDGWSLNPRLGMSERHCYGPEDERLWLSFSRPEGKLVKIAVACVVTLP